MQRSRWTAPIALIVFVAAATVAVGGQLITPLAAFESLAGTSWIGRFTSSPAPPFDHEIKWTVILDGQVVRWTKQVEALAFSMETFFYWDKDLDAIAFMQLGSNGIHSKGVVELDNEAITLVGVAMQTWAPRSSSKPLRSWRTERSRIDTTAGPKRVGLRNT
jgi:hypothetical protein